jgi:hypothetical protein
MWGFFKWCKYVWAFWLIIKQVTTYHCYSPNAVWSGLSVSTHLFLIIVLWMIYNNILTLYKMKLRKLITMFIKDHTAWRMHKVSVTLLLYLQDPSFCAQYSHLVFLKVKFYRFFFYKLLIEFWLQLPSPSAILLDNGSKTKQDLHVCSKDLTQHVWVIQTQYIQEKDVRTGGIAQCLTSVYKALG